MQVIFPFNDVSGTQMSSWGYSRDAPLEKIFPAPTIKTPLNENEFKIGRQFPSGGYYKETQYVIGGSSVPYLPPKITRILERGKKRPLRSKVFSKLMENIADISIKFYNIKNGKFVAIDFNGRVVESADSQLDLLSKIQGKKFRTQVFVWRAGSDVFSGWTT